MNYKKVLIILMSLVWCGGYLVAGGRIDNRTGNIPGSQELRFGFISEPTTLDPLNPSNTADGRSILFNVFEGLVKPDPEGRLQPCLAESWRIEEGGRIYHFTLRQGIRFHDGSPVKAADVKFTLDTAVAVGFAGFTQIAGIETPDDAAIRVILRQPDPEFLPYLTIGVVKADTEDREKTVIGTGPFRITSYQVQRSLVLERFADYWQRGLPRLDRVTIVFLADSDALLLGLRGGSIDGAQVSGSIAAQLDPRRFDIVPGYSATVQLLALNNAVTPLDDQRIRQAINYGIDIQGIIDTAFYGRGEPSGSPLIPGLAASYDKTLTNPYPVNPDRARSLLAQAGYGGGTDQRKLSLEITVPANYSMHVDTAQVIAGQLAAIGVNTTIKLVDWATWLSDVYRNRQYQATIISLDASNVSPRSFLSRYHSQNGSNFINFNSAEYDRIYDAALTEAREDRRIALYQEAQRIISDAAASVYIQDIVGFQVFRTGTFGGVTFYPLYVIDFASLYGITP